MKVYHIAAMSENRVIGKGGEIPWHLPSDLKRFQEITSGHAVVMGRKTYESLGSYAPLPERHTVVLSNQEEWSHTTFEGLLETGNTTDIDETTSLSLADSVAESFRICQDHSYNEVYIAGGGEVYRKTLHIADELRLTLVHRDVEGGDVFYPSFDESEWAPSFVEPHDEYTFIDYIRPKGVSGSSFDLEESPSSISSKAS